MLRRLRSPSAPWCNLLRILQKGSQVTTSNAERPDSPCVGVCTTLYDENCRACGRHYIEVANWNQLDQAKKDEIWSRISAHGYPRRSFASVKTNSNNQR